ncbi:MAG: 2-hydroxy-3-oxopropionate reductase [Lachnospiraceae bacterium]|nr:2-hydroxy-3-oxopropionate reductase [Lachnospiraceae bacterium]
MKAGFIGLGIMGKPMAKNLLKGGCELLVYDVNPVVVKEVTAIPGAKLASLEEIGANCEYIFTILPNGTIVQDVLFGENGVAKTIKAGSVVADLSSVTPVESKACAEKLAPLGVDFIDSPVSGGEPKAIDGTLAFMSGGKEEAYNRVLPFFKLMGTSALLVGDTGSGAVTKLANQIIVNLTIAAVSEAFVLATKAGADPEKVYKAIRSGFAQSTVLDAKGTMMIDRNFVPGGKISINRKDIMNVINTAHAIDVPLPLTAQLYEIFQYLKVHGHMDDDHSGIVQYYEDLAGVTVQRKS